ncbi:MAG: hypothetical protein BWY21_00981 [Parcubacteria group bacterium ADurb.Bin216]|nr:MAG: hypothetical protein BWY21_00981 [Parcubacteria group bacterium ADurb.Bin216]
MATINHVILDSGNHYLAIDNGNNETVLFGEQVLCTQVATITVGNVKFAATTDYYKNSQEFPIPSKIYVIVQG